MTAPRETGLEVRGVAVRYSRWGQNVAALHDISLVIPGGQWAAVVGPNGAGKSTLMHVISGTVAPEKGVVLLGGQDIRTISRRARAQEIFLIHQNPLLGTAPMLTVAENLEAATSRSARDGYRSILDDIGLGERLRQPAKLLSGGERQLLTLAVASLRRPRLLLLDEPLAALDPGRAILCLNLIKQINDAGTAVLHITHDLQTILPLVDRVIQIEAGRIVADRGPEFPETRRESRDAAS